MSDISGSLIKGFSEFIATRVDDLQITVNPYYSRMASMNRANLGFEFASNLSIDFLNIHMLIY